MCKETGSAHFSVSFRLAQVPSIRNREMFVTSHFDEVNIRLLLVSG